MDAITEPVLEPEVGQSRPARRRRVRRLLRALIVLAILGAGGLVGNWWMLEGRYLQSTDDAYVQGDIAVLGPRIEGDVQAIPVADNQRVRTGDPLIVLDPRDWQAKLDQARAALAQTEAAVLSAERQIPEQQASVQAAEAQIAQAEAQQALARADSARSDALLKNGWASRQSNDQALADRRKAEAGLATATAQKAAAERQLTVIEAQLVQARANRQSAAAALRLGENNLSYTVIRAPFDGVVGNRAAQLGEHVAPGAQLIAVAPLPDKLYVLANFKETQLRRMTPGMRVSLSADIADNETIQGTVNSLAPATGALFSLLPPENATGNFTRVVQRVPVKIVLDPRQAQRAPWLRAGLSVTAEVDTRGAHAQRLGLFGAAATTLDRFTR